MEQEVDRHTVRLFGASVAMDTMQRIISKHQHSDGLIGLWPNNQMLGTVSYDFSKDQGHGTHSNVANRHRMNRSRGHYMNASGYDPKSLSYTDILTAQLIANFDGDAGAAFVFCKTDAAWAEGINRYALHLGTDADNLIFFRKDTVPGRLYIRHRAAATGLSQAVDGMTTTDLFCMAMMWDQVGAEVRVFLDGAYDSRGINPDPWEGGDLTYAVIGAETLVPAGGWDGGIGLVALYNQTKTDDEMLKLSTP